MGVKALAGVYVLAFAYRTSPNRQVVNDVINDPIVEKHMAMRDAAALRRALVKVAHGEPLLEVLAGYEREMIEYGFRAVRLSLENMGRVHSEGLMKGFTKFAFRLMNLSPSLKDRFRNS